MADKVGTQWVRKEELGMHTDDTFLCYVVCKLNWSIDHIQQDLKHQLMRRLNNEKLADEMLDQIMIRLKKRFSIKKIKDSVSGAIDSVKNFELTPWTIAQLAYGNMARTYEIAKFSDRMGHDRNIYHYTYPSERDDCIDYMIMTYVINGQVQPRYTGEY